MPNIDIIEPERMKVVWKSSNGSRRNFHVADLLRSDGDKKIQFIYNTNSDDFKLAEEQGFQGYFAFPLKQSSCFDTGIMEVLSRRLPPRSRSDFDSFLKQWAIPESQEISDFALLGYSRGSIPGDDFSFYPYWEDYDLPCSFLIEVAGFRYHAGMEMDLDDVSNIKFQIETDNDHDNNAVSIWSNNQKIGYVNRTLTNAFHKWINQGSLIEASVYRVNGTEDRPRVHLQIAVS